MKKILQIIYTILFSALFALSALTLHAQIDPNVKPVPTQAKPIKIGEFHTFVTDNNMKVFLIRKTGYPKFRISIQFGVPYIQQETQPEVKSVVSHIFSKGSSLFTAQEMKDKADYYAATVLGSVINVTCTGMKNQLDMFMPMMSSYLTSPAINEANIEEAVQKGISRVSTPKKASKQNLINELKDSLSFYKNCYPNPVEESVEGYKAVNQELVAQFFNTYINPENSFCIMSGDFTVEEANEVLTSYLKGWKSGSKIERDEIKEFTTNFPVSRTIYVFDKPNAVQSRIDVRWPLGDAFPYGNNEPLLMVMNQIYGSGFLSNLNKNIRIDKGLSYGANNILAININGGFSSSGTLVSNSETVYALENILFEMLRMRNELVSQEDLDIAKNGLIGDFARNMSVLNSPAIIGFGMVKDKYDLPDDYLQNYPLHISKITAQDIRAASQKYINPFECVIYIDGIVDELRGKLEKFGPVEYYSQDGIRL